MEEIPVMPFAFAKSFSCATVILLKSSPAAAGAAASAFGASGLAAFLGSAFGAAPADGGIPQCAGNGGAGPEKAAEGNSVHHVLD